MKIQPQLFEIEPESSAHAIVNVATVPQRSPFRYPGGKTWLIPEVRKWLSAVPKKPHLFIEPFAGGGIASLTVAFERLADHVIMVELDDNVASVWKVILTEANWLKDRILNFEMSLENVRELINCQYQDIREKAFQTILRNRVQRGGIMAPGASLMKMGENGRGVASRWYPKTLAKRIWAIYEQREQITFIEGDGLKVIADFLGKTDVAFFIDPPYTASAKKAGKRLYLHNQIDHEKLFLMMSEAKGVFMMTYDDSDEVERMAHVHRFKIRRVPMKNTHHRKQYELLIGPASTF